MMAAAVTFAVLVTMTGATSAPGPMAPVAVRVVQTTLPPTLLPSSQAVHLGREPPPGSGAEFVRYASPPELHNGFLLGGLFAWTGALIGGLMFLERRRIVSLVIGGGGLAVGLALMLIG